MKLSLSIFILLLGILPEFLAADLLPAGSEEIAVFNFDRPDPTSTENFFSSTDSNSLTIASDVSAAVGDLMNGFGGNTIPAGPVGSEALTFPANTLNTGAFFEFTIELGPTAAQVELHTLTFDAFVADTLANTTQFNYELFVNDFTTPLGTAVGPAVSGGGSQNNNFPITFDLSVLPVQTSDVVIRLAPVFASGSQTNGGGSGPSSQRLGGVDNLILNATATAVPVPEPASSFFLFAIGSITATRRARRHE